MAVDPIPADYPRVVPALSVDGAAAAIEFYKDVLGATERMRMEGPPGRVAHAELAVGGSVIMLADEFPDLGFVGPRAVGGTPVTITAYVEDVDAAFDRAVAAGAEVLAPPEDQFYGDRVGRFVDPWGHRWSVASRVEELTAEEMEARTAEAAEDLGAG